MLPKFKQATYKSIIFQKKNIVNINLIHKLIGSRCNSNGLSYHMSQVHGMEVFEFKSHSKSKKSVLSKVVDANTKKRLNNLAIKAIVHDNLPFGVFRKPGIKTLVSV